MVGVTALIATVPLLPRSGAVNQLAAELLVYSAQLGDAELELRQALFGIRVQGFAHLTLLARRCESVSF